MAQLKKILLVDDDDDLREALSEQLIMTEDFDVFEGREWVMTQWTAPKRPCMIWSFWMWGCLTLTGANCAVLMRKQGVKSPILMLTGHDSDGGYDFGAGCGRQ